MLFTDKLLISLMWYKRDAQTLLLSNFTISINLSRQIFLEMMHNKNFKVTISIAYSIVLLLLLLFFFLGMNHFL
jgi:hypothetical protein